jgi:hypothetical protein
MNRDRLACRSWLDFAVSEYDACHSRVAPAFLHLVTFSALSVTDADVGIRLIKVLAVYIRSSVTILG